ncbi:hypothetical protein LGM42_32520 [Burkholderia sp. AU39826]|uniref:hypothetical protein n=1 Tax=Burkholderia sp. AU39826 TaxID=2879634 RepID=UPI001CF493A0|nr:hypothetical protein [Burkholderia sp. AU39826]MCA7974602.1 hypothetical protein [Burkholderia sp. AU39826]
MTDAWTSRSVELLSSLVSGHVMTYEVPMVSRDAIDLSDGERIVRVSSDAQLWDWKSKVK